jgi:hypothetical protein
VNDEDDVPNKFACILEQKRSLKIGNFIFRGYLLIKLAKRISQFEKWYGIIQVWFLFLSK